MNTLPASTTPTTLGPINIEIGGPGSASYKSIDHVVWENVPPFVVLTGLNGSGKSQLLEVLAYGLTHTLNPTFGDMSGIHVRITGDDFGPDSVAYVSNRWDLSPSPSLGVAQMQSAVHQLWNDLTTNNVRHSMSQARRRARILKTVDVSDLQQLDPQRLGKLLPDDFSFMLDEDDLTLGLAHIFLAYRVRTAEALEAGTSHPEVRAKLGPAPWDLVNETFKAAEFPYRVVSPAGKLLEPYEILLEDTSTALRLRPTDLSSGEKVLLALVLWLYNSQHHGRFPRLFLLDEPDSHLHPSMTRHLLNVINEVLVGRYGVRTILTTHSPSTGCPVAA